MTGTIFQVNVSRGGLPKRPVSEGLLTRSGFEADAWMHPAIHGGPDKAVLVIAAEGIDELIALGYPLFYGALGENLTTRGLDRRQFRVGQQWRVGQALMEFSRVRVPCATLDIYGASLRQAIYDAQVQAGDPASPRWGLSGFYARVLQPGLVRTNDIMTLLAALA